jgi:hypothetical protein
MQLEVCVIGAMPLIYIVPVFFCRFGSFEAESALCISGFSSSSEKLMLFLLVTCYWKERKKDNFSIIDIILDITKHRQVKICKL